MLSLICPWCLVAVVDFFRLCAGDKTECFSKDTLLVRRKFEGEERMSYYVSSCIARKGFGIEANSGMQVCLLSTILATRHASAKTLPGVIR